MKGRKRWIEGRVSGIERELLCKDEMQRWRRDDIWRERAMEVKSTLGRMGERSAVRREGIGKSHKFLSVLRKKGRSHQKKEFMAFSNKSRMIGCDVPISIVNPLQGSLKERDIFQH